MMKQQKTQNHIKNTNYYNEDNIVRFKEQYKEKYGSEHSICRNCFNIKFLELYGDIKINVIKFNEEDLLEIGSRCHHNFKSCDLIPKKLNEYMKFSLDLTKKNQCVSCKNCKKMGHSEHFCIKKINGYNEKKHCLHCFYTYCKQHNINENKEAIIKYCNHPIENCEKHNNLRLTYRQTIKIAENDAKKTYLHKNEKIKMDLSDNESISSIDDYSTKTDYENIKDFQNTKTNNYTISHNNKKSCYKKQYDESCEESCEESSDELFDEPREKLYINEPREKPRFKDRCYGVRRYNNSRKELYYGKSHYGEPIEESRYGEPLEELRYDEPINELRYGEPIEESHDEENNVASNMINLKNDLANLQNEIKSVVGLKSEINNLRDEINDLKKILYTVKQPITNSFTYGLDIFNTL